jgi:hypothetical protein
MRESRTYGIDEAVAAEHRAILRPKKNGKRA